MKTRRYKSLTAENAENAEKNFCARCYVEGGRFNLEPSTNLQPLRPLTKKFLY